MNRRIFLLLALAAAVSGCAGLKSALADPSFDASSEGLSDAPADRWIPAPKVTADQAYDAGVLDLVRGDDVAARREWNRCVAISTPDSAARLDCMVALEKLAAASVSSPE